MRLWPGSWDMRGVRSVLPSFTGDKPRGYMSNREMPKTEEV